MPRNDTPYLVVASSGRALAQSAWRNGYRVVVLDFFADQDTRRYALAAERVAASEQLCFDPDRLLEAARAHGRACVGIVPGAGFEDDAGLLARLLAALGTQCRLLGNTPARIARLAAPEEFFALLDEIGFPYPETRMTAPLDGADWLVKQAGASGGGHVQLWRGARNTNARTYFQRRVSGTPASALFLADGARARIIGFSEQLTTRIGAADYWYAGAIGDVPLAEPIARDIAARLDGLVARTGLVGMNSLDFVLGAEAQDYAVLEVNARPSATMDCYDADYPAGLFAAHVDACAGVLGRGARSARTVRAHRVIYALDESRIPEDFLWPDWCTDLEAPGTRFNSGAPICMVHAHGEDRGQVRARLAARARQLEQRFRA